MIKKLYHKAFIFLFAAASASPVLAQDFIAESIKGGITDGTELLKAYMAPYSKGFGAGLNGGWYNTAKTNKLLRPDFLISINTVFIPASDKSFDIKSLPMTNVIEPADPSQTITPTIAGKREEGPAMIINNNNGMPGNTTFKMPQGTGVSFIPVPTMQLGLGLIKNTDLVFRYVPKININNFGSIGLWGIGVKHDIKQWIPGISMLPFDLSVFGGLTSFTTNIAVSVTANPSSINALPSYEGQSLQINVKSYTFAAILSKKIALLTVYGALGYDGSVTSLDLKGVYPVVTSFDATQGKDVITNYTDPISGIKIEGSNAAKANIGFKLSFLRVVNFNVDYTYSLSKYSYLSLGFGLAFPI